MSPVLPEQQTGVATPPKCNSGSWDMGQGFSYPCQTVSIQQLQFLEAWWLMTLCCTSKPCSTLKGHDRFWWLLWWLLRASTFLPRRVFQQSAVVRAPCRELQSKVTYPCPQGWVLCLAMQESQGMCRADTCTGGTGVLEKGEWSSTNAVGMCTMHLLLWKL